jgi:integrase
MIKKNLKTECSGLEWGQFLTLTEKLKRNKNTKFLLLVSIGGYCGLRLGDMLRLKWSDVISHDELILNEGKTGKHRKITFNQNLIEIIKFCHENTIKEKPFDTNNYIFCNRNNKPLTRQYINRQLHLLFKTNKIKVQNGSSHTLRKTFGKRVYEMNDNSEASLVLLSSIFNHSSTSITRKYIGLTQQKIQDVYMNL